MNKEADVVLKFLDSLSGKLPVLSLFDLSFNHGGCGIMSYWVSEKDLFKNVDFKKIRIDVISSLNKDGIDYLHVAVYEDRFLFRMDYVLKNGLLYGNQNHIEPFASLIYHNDFKTKIKIEVKNEAEYKLFFNNKIIPSIKHGEYHCFEIESDLTHSDWMEVVIFENNLGVIRKHKFNLFAMSKNDKMIFYREITIQGNTVFLSTPKSPDWSLYVAFEDGSELNVLSPVQSYQFEKKISRVVLTDSLDIDWFVESN